MYMDYVSHWITLIYIKLYSNSTGNHLKFKVYFQTHICNIIYTFNSVYSAGTLGASDDVLAYCPASSFCPTFSYEDTCDSSLLFVF